LVHVDAEVLLGWRCNGLPCGIQRVELIDVDIDGGLVVPHLLRWHLDLAFLLGRISILWRVV
jgi:hypothetical protein